MTLACSFSVDLGDRLGSEIFSVEASEGWTNTHINIEDGYLLTITYLSGRWSPGLDVEVDSIGYGGDPRSMNNVIMGVSHAALIGRIGDHEPFLVGERYHHSMGESGILYLGINDSDLDNNLGHLQVKVEVAEQ